VGITFVSMCFIVIIVLGMVASLMDTVVLLTSYAVIMAILFVITLLGCVTLIILDLLTNVNIKRIDYLPVVMYTSLSYLISIMSMAQRESIMRADVRS